MQWLDMLGGVGVVTGLLAFVGSVLVARIQARGGAMTRGDARVDQLEKALDVARGELAGAREKALADKERLMDEEESMRDKHAHTVLELRERYDASRVQSMAMRAELLRRGVNPDRLLGEPVAA